MSAALLLCACGFHLRGNMPLPPELHTVAIVSNDPYGALTLELTQILKSMGADIVDKTAHPPTTLVLEAEGYSQTTVRESASFSVQQYMMEYYVTYHVTRDKRTYGPRTIKSKQLYAINQNQVLSTDIQQEELRKQMQQSAVYQIISQLNSPDAIAALTAPPTPAAPPKKAKAKK